MFFRICVGTRILAWVSRWDGLLATYPAQILIAALGQTPREAIEGNYVDKKCPFTGNVSIRGRIMTGIVKTFKVRSLFRAMIVPSVLLPVDLTAVYRWSVLSFCDGTTCTTSRSTTVTKSVTRIHLHMYRLHSSGWRKETRSLLDNVAPCLKL